MKNTAIDPESRRAASEQAWLVGGGAMGEHIRNLDWSQTPLGPIESWPQSLRTIVNLCLASSFPISIAWGRQHTQIYNDGYWPICGGKHPGSMGQDFRECWACAWPAIGEAFERALSGQSSFLENQRMFLDRNGYLEETFFTFSFSPIRDESGGVGGLFHPVTETTSRMLAERRTRMLRDLNAGCAQAQTRAEAYVLACQTLQDFSFDLPFVLVYEVGAGSQTATLVAATGIEAGSRANPTVIALDAQAPLAPWPIAEVAHSNIGRRLDDLEARLGPERCGPYPEAPKSAWLVPITLPGAEHATGVIVLGISPRLPLNDDYRACLESVGGAFTAAVTRARAYEERRRADPLAELDRAQTVTTHLELSRMRSEWAEQLERSNRELEAFSYSVSHDLRAPLRAIDGFSKALLTSHGDKLDGQAKDYLDRVRSAAQRMSLLIDDLLKLSRITRADLRRETVDLTCLARTVAEELARQPRAQPVHFEVEECLTTHGDPRLLRIVMTSLLDNAWKFTSKTPNARVRVGKTEGANAAFFVRDNGAGFDMAYADSLFRPFQRLHPQAEYDGTGIGLATVLRVVDRHGGRVWAEGAVDAGATVYFTLERAHDGTADVARGGQQR